MVVKILSINVLIFEVARLLARGGTVREVAQTSTTFPLDAAVSRDKVSTK